MYILSEQTHTHTDTRRLYSRIRSYVRGLNVIHGIHTHTSPHWAVTFSYTCFRIFSPLLSRRITLERYLLVSCFIFFLALEKVAKKMCGDEPKTSERACVRNEIYFNHFSIANIDSQITKVIYVPQPIFVSFAWCVSAIVSSSGAQKSSL